MKVIRRGMLVFIVMPILLNLSGKAQGTSGQEIGSALRNNMDIEIQRKLENQLESHRKSRNVSDAEITIVEDEEMLVKEIVIQGEFRISMEVLNSIVSTWQGKTIKEINFEQIREEIRLEYKKIDNLIEVDINIWEDRQQKNRLMVEIVEGVHH